MDPYLGEIRLFAGNYAPKGWALCQGQMLPIRQYTALFSLLGVNYGGDGRVTFALPDLRGRVSVGTGQGSGLSPYSQGEMAGTETVALTTDTMGGHSHQLQAVSANADQTSPTGTVLSTFPQIRGQGVPSYAPAGAATPVAMSTQALGNGGGSANPHPNLQPYLTLNYIIAMEGIFPPRP